MQRHPNPRTRRLPKPRSTHNPRPRRKRGTNPRAADVLRTFLDALAGVDRRTAMRVLEAASALVALAGKQRKP